MLAIGLTLCYIYREGPQPIHIPFIGIQPPPPLPPMTRGGCVHRYLDCAIWPNYEVAEFQPLSGIATVLNSVASDYNLLYLSLPHLSQPLFWIILFPPSLIMPPPSVELVVVPDYLYTRSPTPLPSWYVILLDFDHTHHPPASAAHLWAACRVPASATVYCVRSPPLATCPGPCWPLGCLYVLGPSVSLVSPHLPPCVVHHQI